MLSHEGLAMKAKQKQNYAKIISSLIRLNICVNSFCFFFFLFTFSCSNRKSAPKFLLDVYKQLNDEANGGSNRYTRSADSDEGENFITDTDKVAIEESDMIMTFLNQSKLIYLFYL